MVPTPTLDEILKQAGQRIAVEKAVECVENDSDHAAKISERISVYPVAIVIKIITICEVSETNVAAGTNSANILRWPLIQNSGYLLVPNSLLIPENAE